MSDSDPTRLGEASKPPPADIAERIAAQSDFTRSLVLDAGAGTGKTSVLVARIVTWCLGPGWVENETRLADDATPEQIASQVLRRVVAITFTEAAAAEMASRVGEALRELEIGGSAIGLDSDALPEDAAVRATRARVLLANLDQLSVRTIHGWCRRLLAEQPLEAGLHPRFEVDADGRRTREVVREVLERELVQAYAGSGDPDHLALAAAGHGPDAIEEALRSLIAMGLPAEALQQSPFTPAALVTLHHELQHAYEAFVAAGIGRLAAVKQNPTARSTLEAIEAFPDAWGDTPATDAASLAEQTLALGAVFGDRERARLREWARKLFKKTEIKALGSEGEELAEPAAAFSTVLEHVLAVDPAGLERARRVLAPLLAQVEVELRRRGIESFDALLQDTRRLLATSPEAARRVRGGIDQLLVDEFQDTDRVQCAILASLVLDVPAGEARPQLFLVGDPKQSIYGWRNADLAAYDDFVNRVLAAGGQRHRLSVNFRSVKPILDEVDCVIAPAMIYKARLQPEYEELQVCDKLRNEPGFVLDGCAPVEHWVSWGWGEDGEPVAGLRAHVAAELEARAVAAEISRLGRNSGVPWKSFALLFRGLRDAEIYLGALRSSGVPYVVERDDTYYQRREVIEASALVSTVLDPRDHLALLTFLRSAWVGVPDLALLPLWTRDLPRRLSALGIGDGAALAEAIATIDTVEGELTDDPGLGGLAGWATALRAAVTAIDHLRRSHEADAPDVFVEALRGQLAAEPSEAYRYLGLHRLANLDRFFRDLTAVLEESGGDVGAVLAGLRTVSASREAEEGRPKDAGEDAVHVLTIHKAKGLAFEHVYLMQTHKEGGGRPQAIQVSPRDEGFEFSLFGLPTPGFFHVARSRAEVNDAERVRTLYVAMTRARQRLVLCGRRHSSQKGQQPGGHARLLLERAEGTPDLEAMMRDLAQRGAHGEDEAKTRWVFPALRHEPALEPDAPPPEPDASSMAADAETLARARHAAAQRAARSFTATASAEKPSVAIEAALGEDADDGADPAPRTAAPLERGTALAVGTAFHAALEQLDAAADPGHERAEAGSRAVSVLHLLAPPDQHTAADGVLADLLDRWFDGPLHQRFVEIAGEIVARELPVWLGPQDDAASGEPVGFHVGAVDLLYRDPVDDRFVVADYKTDAVAGSELETRARAYAAQGRVYVEAVQQALGLSERPRFELWFAHAGVVQRVATGPTTS